MSFVMRTSLEVGEEDYLVAVGRTKSWKPYHRLVQPTGIGAQEEEAPGGCVAAGQNPLIGLLWPIKLVSKLNQLN